MIKSREQLSLFPPEPLPTTLPARVKAITLWQPWASAMAAGLKRIETRGYPAERLGLRSGDLLAIHAAKRPIPTDELAWWKEHGDTALTYDALPHSAILCVVRYLESVRTGGWFMPSDEEAAWGDYSDGRYGWLTEPCLTFTEPVPMKGAQCVWWWEGVAP